MISAVIVDDEERVRCVIRSILESFCPHVYVAGEAGSVDTGHTLIIEKQPDLVFLDIELSGGSGFNLLERLEEKPFKTIFITAYNQYAIQAIRMSALDYILKPVNSTELIAAVERFDKHKNELSNIEALFKNLRSSSRPDKIAIPSVDKIRYMDIDKIIRCESDGTYTFIVTEEEKITSTKPLKEYEYLLENKGFFRIHKSHLVNLDKVKEYFKKGRSAILLKNGEVLDVSKRKRTTFLQIMLDL